MQWITDRPTVPGRYRWREHDKARVHVVRAIARKQSLELKCSTMDLRKVLAGGQWSVAGDTGQQGDS
jgi:hypothetical protein